MTPVEVWARRSLALWLAPFVLGAMLVATWSGDGWQYESLWGLRAAIGTAGLVSALLAAGVAFDVVRFWGPLVATLGPSTRRWRHATVALVVAHLSWMLACVCVIWGAVGVRLVAHDAIWQPDPWLPFEVLAGFAAAAGVGLVLGMRVRSLAAPPLAAVVVLATQALAVPYGLGALYAPTAVVDSVVGLERDPGAAAMSVGLDLTVAAWCGIVALAGPDRTARWTTAAAVAVAFLAVTVVHATVKPLEYRATRGPDVCREHGSVRACGPKNASSLVLDLRG